MKTASFVLGCLLSSLLVACDGTSSAPATTTPAATIVPPGPTATSQSTLSPVEVVWKTNGAPNPFNSPSGLALDQQGNLYVADAGNNRIQKFDSNGRFITTWGSFGIGEGQFDFMEHVAGGVAVDGQGNVYIADGANSRVQKFDDSGKFLAEWGTRGLGDGQFSAPVGVAVDGQGNVYVSDAKGGRIQKFDSNGTFLTKWGSFGDGNGQFKFPAFIAIDAQGNVYATDFQGSNIQKFDRNGQFLAKWNTCGTGKFQFINASAGVAIDVQGNIYVADLSNNRVCKYDSSGGFLTTWGSSGNGDGQFTSPGGIVVDQQGNVYVADGANNRIQKFRQR